jgi:transaldolase
MRIFLDSANRGEIAQACRRGFVSGITTNPSLIRQENSDAIKQIDVIVSVLNEHDMRIPLSVQVMTRNPVEMVRQAEMITERVRYPDLVIKVPCGWDELEVIHTLSQRGVTINCTACITFAQAKLAAAAGARYVSLFYGKMGDAGIDAAPVIEQVVRELERGQTPCELVVASIRKPFDITEIMTRGAHIVSIPFKYLPQLCGHSKTDEAIQGFASDFLPIEVSSPH